jgi:hypothetical protein
LGFDETIVKEQQKELNNRLQQIRKWSDKQKNQSVQYKARIIGQILLDDVLAACYYECLSIAPDFAYPIQLVPRADGSTLLFALSKHLAARQQPLGLITFERTPNLFFLL